MPQPWRRIVALAALLWIVLLQGHAHSHNDEAPSLQVSDIDMGPGHSYSTGLVFEGGELPADSVLLMSAISRNGTGPVDVQFQDENGTYASWTIPFDAAVHDYGVHVRATSHHDFVFANPGPTYALANYFFDVSCSCREKTYPVALPDGLLIFEVKSQEREAVTVRISDPAALDLVVEHRRPVISEFAWPNHVTTLETSEEPTFPEGREVHEFTWVAEQDWVDYFVVRAVNVESQYYASLPREAAAASILVQMDVERAETSPAPDALIALGLVAVIVAVRWRRNA